MPKIDGTRINIEITFEKDGGNGLLHLKRISERLQKINMEIQDLSYEIEYEFNTSRIKVNGNLYSEE